MSRCCYAPAWQKPCNKPCEGVVCEEHAKQRCCVCGAQAVHECDHAGQFVCGARLCADCEGFTDPGQPSGSWGFLNHGHRRREKRDV